MRDQNRHRPHHKTTEQTIFDEAQNIIAGARQNEYGRADQSFTNIAKVWSAILKVDVSPEQVALCMAGLKLVRESYAHKRDNLVDAIGYVGLLELICNPKK